MRKAQECKVYQVDFNKRELTSTYIHDWQKEHDLKQEFYLKLDRCAAILQELYKGKPDGNIFLDYIGRCFKGIIFKIKE